MTCIVCHHPLNRLGVRQGYTYVWCSFCGTVQLETIPTPDELELFYTTKYHSAGHYYTSVDEHQKDRQRVTAFLVRTIEQQHTPNTPGHVVEIGAGWGNLGQACTQAGLPYLGVEPSEVMYRKARERGLDMLQGSIEALENMEHRPTIRTFVLMAVYEHLPQQEEMLLRMKSMLSEGGSIILQCPTAGFPRWVGRALQRIAPEKELPGVFGSLAPPWHVCLPSPQGLRIQAKRCGLSVESIVPSPSGRRGDWRKLLQIANEWISDTGFQYAGERWPFSMAHVFVLRRP